jgi:VWFA-related protein
MVAAGTLLGHAQAQVPTQRFVGETTVNVIEVPVRVIDPETGEAVRGLTIDDFRIVEGGTEQQITNFSEISSQMAISSPGAEPSSGQESQSAEPVRKPLEIVYFFDLYLMYKSDRDRALQALTERYRSGVPDGENVSVVIFDGALETFLDRSDFREDVLDALEEIRYVTARGPQQTIAFTDSLTNGPVSGERNIDFYERRQRSREYIFELERKIRQVGDALSAAMARYARAEGRKVMVAFTPGYPRAEWSPSYSPVDYLYASVEYPTEKIWDDVAHQAADLGFTLYTIDSSGVRVPVQGLDEALTSNDGFVDFSTAADSPGQPTAQIAAPTFDDPALASVDPNAPNSLGQWIERNRKGLLISASQATGGSALFAGEVRPALDEVTSSLDHYYSLAYTADHIGDGNTYEIEVRLTNGSDYRLLHRTAYVDQPASTRAAQRLRSEMLFGGDANPLGVRIDVGEVDKRFRLGAKGSKRVKVHLHLKIPYGRLDMVSRGDIYWGKVMITLFNQDDAGNQSQLASFEQPITVAADRYQEAVAKGYFAYDATVEIEGGHQNVYVGIEDVISGKTSIMPQEFDF